MVRQEHIDPFPVEQRECLLRAGRFKDHVTHRFEHVGCVHQDKILIRDQQDEQWLWSLRCRGFDGHCRLRSGDAENTMEPKDSYDAITNRPLVWTWVDPASASANGFPC